MKVTDMAMEDLAQILKLQMESGGLARLVVTGNSMYPTLRHKKDVVFLSQVQAPLKKGDLILYQRENGQYVLHRIVKKPKADRLICCGDNQWEQEIVYRSQVVAIVHKFLKNGKTHHVDDFDCRLWVGFLVSTFPLRRPLLAIRRRLGRLRRKFRK